MLYKKRMQYFFGKATIYPDYPEPAREAIQYFLHKYFGKKSKLIHIRKEVKVKDPKSYSKLFRGLDFKEGYRVLKVEVQKYNVFIPPLVNTYMNLSPSMIYFGTGINDEFADVFDSGILIDFTQMYPEKIQRHSHSFMALGWKQLRETLKRFSKKKKKSASAAQ